MLRVVADDDARAELTLGLGLRVVKALVSQQPSLRLRQHHGSHYHATSLSFPAAAPDKPERELADAVKEQKGGH